MFKDTATIPMGGRKFTRMNKFGTKLSKIDCILVCNRFISKWPNEQLMALPRELSDHCPLVQRTHSDNYGPIPFKFFNSWLSHAKLEVFDTKAENGGLEGQEIEERLAIMKQLEDMDHFISSMFKTLSNVEVGLLDAPFTTKEIKSMVWDCGGSKAPRPNGFTFKFIKLYWDTIGNEFIEMAK
ncbi:cytochrome P450 [Tanacetum coccineum]